MNFRTCVIRVCHQSIIVSFTVRPRCHRRQGRFPGNFLAASRCLTFASCPHQGTDSDFCLEADWLSSRHVDCPICSDCQACSVLALRKDYGLWTLILTAAHSPSLARIALRSSRSGLGLLLPYQSAMLHPSSQDLTHRAAASPLCLLLRLPSISISIHARSCGMPPGLGLLSNSQAAGDSHPCSRMKRSCMRD